MFARLADIECSNLGNELLIYNSANSSVHILNRTAKVIWDVLPQAVDLIEIESAVRSSFQIGHDTDLGSDVRETIQQLMLLGLIHEAALP
jgi:PqqD family protein of HPr-rel-A system